MKQAFGAAFILAFSFVSLMLWGSGAAFAAEGTGKKILVAYFSHSGNTREIATQIHEKVGGDIFEIKTVQTYPAEYNECVQVAKREQQNDERPQLATEIPDMASYDVVFLGYPNWWGTMPMVMFTFLGHYDLAGRRIIPFCTNEGSGLGSSERDLKKLCSGAEVLPGLSIHGAEAAQSEEKVAAWAKKSAQL